MANIDDYTDINDIDIEAGHGAVVIHPVPAQEYATLWRQALLVGEEIAKGAGAGIAANYTGAAVTQFGIINTFPGIDIAGKVFAGIALATSLAMTYEAATTARNFSRYYLKNRMLSNAIGAAVGLLFAYEVLHTSIHILMGGADGARYFGGAIIGQLVKYVALEVLLKAIAPFGHYVADMDGKEIRLRGKATLAHAAAYLAFSYPLMVMWPSIVFGQQRIAAGEKVPTILGIPTDFGAKVPPGQNPLFKIGSAISKITQAALLGEGIARGAWDRAGKQVVLMTDLARFQKKKYQIRYRPVREALGKMAFLPTLGKPETRRYGLWTGTKKYVTDVVKSTISRQTLWSTLGLLGPFTQGAAMLGPQANASFQWGSSAISKLRDDIWVRAALGKEGKYYWDMALPPPAIGLVPLAPVVVDAPIEVRGTVNGQSALAALRNLGDAEVFTAQDPRQCFLGLFLQAQEKGTLTNQVGIQNVGMLSVDRIRNANEAVLNTHLPPGTIVSFTRNDGGFFSVGPGIGDLSRDLEFVVMKMFLPDLRPLNHTGTLSPEGLPFGASRSIDSLDQEVARHLINNSIGSALIHFRAPDGAEHNIALMFRQKNPTDPGSFYLADPIDRSQTTEGKNNGWEPGVSSTGSAGSTYSLPPANTPKEQLLTLSTTLRQAYFGIINVATQSIDLFVSSGVPLRINLDRVRFPFIPLNVPAPAIGHGPNPVQPAIQNLPQAVGPAVDAPVIAVYGQRPGQSSFSALSNLGGDAGLFTPRFAAQFFLGTLLESNGVGTLVQQTGVVNLNALTVNGIRNADDYALIPHLPNDLPPGSAFSFDANGRGSFSFEPGFTHLSGDFTFGMMRVFMPDTRPLNREGPDGPDGFPLGRARSIDSFDEAWTQHVASHRVGSAIIRFQAPNGRAHEIALTFRGPRDGNGRGRYYLADSVDRSQTDVGRDNGWRQGRPPNNGGLSGSYYAIPGDPLNPQLQLQSVTAALLRSAYLGIIDFTACTVETFVSSGRPRRIGLVQANYPFIPPHDPGLGGGRGLGGPGGTLGGPNFGGGAPFGGLGGGRDDSSGTSYGGAIRGAHMASLTPDFDGERTALFTSRPLSHVQSRIEELPEIESRFEELQDDDPVIPALPKTPSHLSSERSSFAENDSLIKPPTKSSSISSYSSDDFPAHDKRNTTLNVTANASIGHTEDEATASLTRSHENSTLLTNLPLHHESSSVTVNSPDVSLDRDADVLSRSLKDEKVVIEKTVGAGITPNDAQQRQQRFISKAIAAFMPDDSTKNVSSPDKYLDSLTKRLMAGGVIEDKSKVKFKRLKDKNLVAVITLSGGQQITGNVLPILTPQQVQEKRAVSDSLFSRFSINDKDLTKTDGKLLLRLTQVEALRDCIRKHMETIAPTIPAPKENYGHLRRSSLSSLFSSNTTNSGSSVQSVTKQLKRATAFVSSFPRRRSSVDESSLLLKNESISLLKKASTQESVVLFSGLSEETQIKLAKIINDSDIKFKKWELKPAALSDSGSSAHLSSGSVVEDIPSERTKIVQQSGTGTLKLCIAQNDLYALLPAKGQSVSKSFHKDVKKNASLENDGSPMPNAVHTGSVRRK